MVRDGVQLSVFLCPSIIWPGLCYFCLSFSPWRSLFHSLSLSLARMLAQNFVWIAIDLICIANVSIQFSIKLQCTLRTWNDVVNADTISYMISHGWPGSGLNGVNTYCIPNNGTNNNVALKLMEKKMRHVTGEENEQKKKTLEWKTMDKKKYSEKFNESNQDPNQWICIYVNCNWIKAHTLQQYPIDIVNV